MVRKLTPLADARSARDQSPWGESAAFLIESIIRETITGRYLRPVVGRLNKYISKRKTHTTIPLIVVKGSAVRRAALRAG